MYNMFYTLCREYWKEIDIHGCSPLLNVNFVLICAGNNWGLGMDN